MKNLPDQGNAGRSFILSLAERYSPQQEEFEVSAVGGEVFRFKAVSSLSDINDLKRGVTDFIEMFRTGAVHPDWKPYATNDHATLSAVYCIAHMSLGFKDHTGEEHPALTQLDCLILASKSWTLFDVLQTGIDANQYRPELLQEKKSASEKIANLETS